MDSKQQTGSPPTRLSAGGRPVAWAPDLRDYRRRKYERAQERLRQRYLRGLTIPRIR